MFCPACGTKSAGAETLCACCFKPLNDGDVEMLSNTVVGLKTISIADLPYGEPVLLDQSQFEEKDVTERPIQPPTTPQLQPDMIQPTANIDGYPTRLKHGVGVMPPDPLGHCNFAGCQNEALYVCYVEFEWGSSVTDAGGKRKY